MNVSKNRTISQIAAKASARLFMLLLALAIVPLWLDPEITQRLETTYLYIPNKWFLLFPALLLIGFLVLYMYAASKKFKHPDFNWLLTLNSAILIIYLVLLYTRFVNLLTP